MKRLLLVAACFVLFALLACGGGDEPSSEQPPTATNAPVPTATNRPASPTDTPVSVPYFTVNSAQVNVRTGPGTVFAIVGTVEQGDRFDISGRNAAGDWLEFCCVNVQRGWIYAQLLNVSQETTSIPLEQDIPSAPAPTDTPVPSPNTPAPAPQPPPAQSCPRTCTEAHEMGLGNMRSDHACYQPKFDRDRDGIACER